MKRLRKERALVDAREALAAASVYNPESPLCLWAQLLLLPGDASPDMGSVRDHASSEGLPNPVPHARVPEDTMSLQDMRRIILRALRPVDGDDWPHQLGSLRRRCTGRTVRDAYYTPRWLAVASVATVVDPLLDEWIAGGGHAALLPEYVRVLDPAVGSGQFLVAVVRRILARAPSGAVTPTQIVSGCCFGMDVDGDAVALAHLALMRLCPTAERLALAEVVRKNCVVGDALVDRAPVHDTFTVVVGNPPWSRLVLCNRRPDFDASRDPRRLLACPNSWPLCAGLLRTQLGTHHFFLERLVSWLLDPGGRFALVLPDSILTSPLSIELFASGNGPLALTEIWQLPSRRVWAEVISQGVAVVIGSHCGNPWPVDYAFRYVLQCLVVPPAAEAPWVRVQSTAEVRLHGTLCPDALLVRVNTEFPTHVDAVPGLRHALGPRTPSLCTGKTIASEPPPWAPPETHPVPIDKGSCFHLRWIFDDYACFPHPFLGHYTVLPHAARPWCRWLLDESRPEIVAVPLYVDREHPGRDQLRACRLPRGRLPDLTVCLFWHDGPLATAAAVADFLLGFWNSRVVERLLCTGLLARSAMWIPCGTFGRVPFPVPDLCTRLNGSAHPLATNWCDDLSHVPGGARPGDVRALVHDEGDPDTAVVWIVSVASARAEALRHAAAALIESSWNPEDANPTAQRNRSWQALTGCAAGGHAVGPDDLASLRAGMHAELAEAIRDFDACVCVVDAGVAALYNCMDAEFEMMMMRPHEDTPETHSML